jgi:hypothetical protein
VKNDIDKAIERIAARIGMGGIQGANADQAHASAVLALTQARATLPAEPRELCVEAGVLLTRAGLAWLGR